MLFITKKLRILTEEVKRYAEGNIYEDIKIENYPPEMRELVNYFMSIIETLRSVTGETQVASSKVFSAVKQVNSVILNSTELAEDIRVASTYTKELTSKIVYEADQATARIEEVRLASKTISDLAENIYEDSIATKVIAQHGGNSVEEVNNAMIKIQSSSDEIGEKIKVLTENTREIDGLLANIQEISTKTNLLALNATIEAARAGDYGRGFAVVANEIQKLAEASTTATNLANQLLISINKGVADADKAMLSGTESVKIGIMAAGSAKNSLKDIIDSTSKVETKLSKASDARRIQSETNESIAKFLGEMASICREADDQMIKVSNYISKQERNLMETEKMGVFLGKVADNLVKTANKIKLIDLTDMHKEALDERIIQLRKILEDTAKLDVILSMKSEKHESVLEKLINNQLGIEAAWTNYKNGEFVISLPPAGIANALSREWFKEAISGRLYVSSIYISAISYKPCITIALPIKDSNEEIIGVLGVDINIDKNR